MASSQRCASWAACAALALAACSHEWDALDPRLQDATGGVTATATSSATGTGSPVGTGTGVGGTGGTGGVTSSSVTGTTGAGAGGGSPVHCAGMGLLADDFSDQAQTDREYYIPSTGLVDGGEAVLTLPVGAASTWHAFESWRYHDLRGDAVSVEVKTMVNTSTTASQFFQAVLDNDNYLELYQREGTLHFAKNVVDSWSELGSVPFDAALHRFWRLREDSGTTYWETSPDGASWNVGAQFATSGLFPLQYVTVNLGAATEGGEVAPGEAHFDDVVGGVPGSPWCKGSSLTDDFDDGNRGPAWANGYADSACSIEETGGELVVTLTDGQEAYCGYMSSAAYDLTGDAIAVKVPAMIDTGTQAQAYFSLATPAGDYIEILQSDGTLHFREVVGGTVVSLATLQYTATDHAWWRLRESAGTTFWETSPDGAAWTVRAQHANPIEVTSLDVELGAGTYQPEIMPGALHFDLYNMVE